MPSSIKHERLQVDRRQTKKIMSSGCTTFFTNPFKMFESFLTMPVHGTSSKYGGPSNHILRWHHDQHFPSILHAPTFCIHVNQAIAHKDIRQETALNNLLMNTPALFKHNHTGTRIQHPNKSSRPWSHRLLLLLST